MKELSDKRFDELLKQKAESFDYDFDESAWNKMEQKLRRRDRIVLIRNSSFALLLLLFCGGAYLLFDNDSVSNHRNKLAKELKGQKQEVKSETPGRVKNNEESEVVVQNDVKQKVLTPQHKSISGNNRNKRSFGNSIVPKKAPPTEIKIAEVPGSSTAIADVQKDVTHAQSSSETTQVDSSTTVASAHSTSANQEEASPKQKKLSFSITALAGPDFSSISSLAGKKGTLNVGLLVNASISEKIILSSGLRYGIKSYAASGYNYQLQNSSRADKIAGIDASCNILEIPLQVSYVIMNAKNKQFRISSGLSSYVMLKEEYNFRYTPESGYKSYLLVKTNENQHYLSVVNLSASYLIKPKSSNLQWAIEPYVKLPLGGVGEGNVRLKSSGISLNLTYDLSKKNK